MAGDLTMKVLIFCIIVSCYCFSICWGSALLSFNAGGYPLKNLDVGNPLEQSYSDKADGFGFGGNFGYFVKNKLIIGLDFNYMSATWKTTRWFTGVVASKAEYSFIQYGTYMMFRPSVSGLHYRINFRLIQISTKYTDDENPLKDYKRSFYTPGIELAIGRKFFLFEGSTVFGEIAYGHLFTKNKKSDISGETDQYIYPYNITYFGIRTGVMFYIGKKNMD